MFEFFKKRGGVLLAPVDGKAIAVTEVEDKVFKDKILGDGIAIEPSSDDVYSPCDGEIFQIAHTFHAVCIKSDDGLEILIHMGLDTVKLEGKGFKCDLKQGQKVMRGDKLMSFDRKFIEKQGFKTVTPCIITNMDKLKSFKPLPGDVIHNETNIIEYRI